MKSIFLVIWMIFFLSSTVMGAPLCSSNAGLAEYIALGSGGCQIADKLLFNFTYAGSGSGGAVPISAGGIAVSTINTPNNPGLTFAAAWSAGSGQTLNSLIQFDVVVLPGGIPIKDISAAMVSGHANDGAATVTEDVTEGGPLASIFLHDDGGEVTNQTVEFPPTMGPIHVAKSISVNGGSNGSAVIGSVTNQFSEGQVIPASSSVPTMTEWGMIILVILLGIGSIYYLRSRVAA